MSSSTLSVRRLTAAALTATALAVTLAACGSSSTPAMGSSGTAPTLATSAPAMPSMSSMGAMPSGDGLAATSSGYTLASQVSTLPAGRTSGYRFTITGPDGKPVTAFTVDQTKKLHFYAIRSDLTGFQHVHPTMAPDGTWTAPLAALTPASWRLFATFTPATGTGAGSDFVLSRTVTVPGTPVDRTLPAASTHATVDGYTVTLTGDLMAGMAHPLTVTITRGGKPVTDLQPYLDTYAHLTAFHEGDAAFAHLHPTTQASGDHGGPTLAFHAELAKAGNWRLFLQFQTAGTLHTAALTLHVS
ncbi:hypothetical protein [Streptacidiphilus fuscans]|uniref:Secreted protein n=1 Tax=Streptacidiphilus fuscans TaxID=2789292 RepID=A0A931AXA0_9ACTN|nr:hypothetical protein [Streptacidiphilus fuscans]MBF9066446.1 hypothetical protein [Streptacidiphilus fuscans]